MFCSADYMGCIMIHEHMSKDLLFCIVGLHVLVNDTVHVNTKVSCRYESLLTRLACTCRQGKFGHAAHFTLRCGRQLASGDYQTPVIALACNFEQSNTLLSHHNAATLVHEFGHALHSLLSRTQYQHLSGTSMCA